MNDGKCGGSKSGSICTAEAMVSGRATKSDLVCNFVVQNSEKRSKRSLVGVCAGMEVDGGFEKFENC